MMSEPECRCGLAALCWCGAEPAPPPTLLDLAALRQRYLDAVRVVEAAESDPAQHAALADAANLWRELGKARNARLMA